ncbi:hypothetical protein [Desulfoscipio gibsoniae]
MTEKEIVIEELVANYLKSDKDSILQLVELFDNYLDSCGNFYLDQNFLFSVSSKKRLSLVV